MLLVRLFTYSIFHHKIIQHLGLIQFFISFFLEKEHKIKEKTRECNWQAICRVQQWFSESEYALERFYMEATKEQHVPSAGPLRCSSLSRAVK